MRTHYDNLHVSEKASQEVIKGAYKALTQKWHPDKNPDQRDKAERYFKIITRAYEILSDPASRAGYDAWLAEQRTANAEHSQANETNERNKQSQYQEDMAEAWGNGKRAYEQGFGTKDCPYSDDLAHAWRQGFKAGQTSDAASSPAPRPWRRFFARLIDTLVFGFASTFIAAFLTVLIFGVSLGSYFSDSMFGWIIISNIGIVLIEAYLIHRFATTPGKLLFGVRVRSSDGTNLSLQNSLMRALGATIIGQAANIPLAVFFASLIAYFKIIRTGSTFWDEQSGSKVECAHLPAGRMIICTLAALSALAVNSILIQMQTKDLGSTSKLDQPQSRTGEQSASYSGDYSAGQPPLIAGSQPPSAVSQPQSTQQELSSKDIHFKKIYLAHPDADSIVDAPAFSAWSAKDPNRQRIVESGTSDEVIALLSAYKAQRGTRPTVPASHATPLRNPYPNCVFYSIMTDEDYAACGIAPPGK